MATARVDLHGVRWDCDIYVGDGSNADAHEVSIEGGSVVCDDGHAVALDPDVVEVCCERWYSAIASLALESA